MPESMPKVITSDHSGISDEYRESEFAKYIDRKSNESPVSIGSVIASSALLGALSGHYLDQSKEDLKKRIVEIISANPGSILAKAQTKALKLLGNFVPDPQNIPILKNYTKTKLIAILAGLGAVHGLNKAMNQSQEQSLARDIKGDKYKLKRELMSRLAEEQ